MEPVVKEKANSISSQRPDLVPYWHPDLNVENTPATTSVGSNQKVWWLCPKGHPWLDSPAKRASAAHPCPVCINKRLLVGVNDLATTHPEVAAEWHPTFNEGLTPQDVVPGTAKSVHWLSPCGHAWKTEVRGRTQAGVTCLYCSGQKVLAGFNDLATKFPQIAALWHPTKNGKVTPGQVHGGSGSSYWWLCSNGHERYMSVDERTRRGTGCSYCTGRLVTAGENDLATTHPSLAIQWHPTKNGSLTPADVSHGSHSRVWWQCEKGHEWDTEVQSRKQGLRECPTCMNSSTSRAEKELFDFVASLSVNGEVLANNRRILKGYELDIYLPEHKFAIEYNGLYWHSEESGKPRSYHHDKWLACKDQGIQLIQVWEDEWARNPAQVKQMIAHKLNVPYGEEVRVMARKTEPITLMKFEAEMFLAKHHIQGFASGSHYIGLVSKGTTGTYKQEDILAVMVLKKEPGSQGQVLNIIRYATSATIPGGFTKLLTHAERTYTPDQFLTFSDNCVSDGGLYERNGFVADKTLPPDYMYARRGQREHKFGYRLKRFRNDPELLWEEGLTEAQLAILNGLERVWDAGKTRWMKTVRH